MSDAYKRPIEKAGELLTDISPRFATLSEDTQRDIARLFISDLIMAQQIPTMALRWHFAGDDEQQAIIELLTFEADENLRNFYAEKIAEHAVGKDDLPADIAAILDECPVFSYAAI